MHQKTYFKAESPSNARTFLTTNMVMVSKMTCISAATYTNYSPPALSLLLLFNVYNKSQFDNVKCILTSSF